MNNTNTLSHEEIFDNHKRTFKFDGLTVEETREIVALD